MYDAAILFLSVKITLYANLYWMHNSLTPLSLYKPFIWL